MAQNKPKLQPKENQHIRLKLNQVQLHYQDGLVTASGLLYYAIGIMRPPGQGIKLQAGDWLRLTGLKRSTFFHAKAKLVAQGYLKEDVADSVEIELAHASKVLDGNFQIVEETFTNPIVKDAEQPKTDCNEPKNDESKILDLPSKILDSQSKILDSESKILDSGSKILDSGSKIRDKSNFKPLSDIVSSVSPDITNKPNTPNPEEGKNFKNFEKKEESKQCLELPETILAEMARLKILGGDRDSKVLETSRSGQFNLAQIKGAIAHVSKTWYNCENPAAIFLYQLPKQSTEAVKKKSDCENLRVPMYIAGLVPLEELHGRYGLLWEDAARHFGHSEEAIAEFKELLSSHT